MKQITGGVMRFKKTIHPNGYLPVVSIFLIALLFIPIAGNAGRLATIAITAVPPLGTPLTIAVGQSVVFTAEGKDRSGNTVPIRDPRWYSGGGHGTIVVDPNDPNKCTYTATNRGADYIQCCDGKPGYGVDGSVDFTVGESDRPNPFSILMLPEDVRITEGDSVCFTVDMFDEDGEEIPDDPVTFTATGGPITPEGVYTGEDVGEQTVTVQATRRPNVTDISTVTVLPVPQCSVEGKVMPPKAKTDGCTVTPESQICVCGIEEIEFTATAVEGWEFHEWKPSNKLQCPSASTAMILGWLTSAPTCFPSSTTETTGWFASALTLAGQSREFLCANDKNRTVTVLPFSLTASIADDWGVSLFVFNASGEGDDKKDIVLVTFNYPGGSKTGTFDGDNGTITFSIGEVLIPAGSTKSFSLVYEFTEMEECCSDYKDFNVTIGQHNALPVASPGHNHGSANGTAIVGCIWNENQEEGYETIQEAVDGASPGDTIMLCPGTYEENVNVNTSLTIKSFGSYLDTTVQAADANDHVFEVTASNTIIDGLTIQNATGNGKAGIHVSAGDCNILNSIIQNNGGAGIVVAKCGEGLILENVKIRNNKGFGIWATENLTINGGNNEIFSNGRDGIFTKAGDVTIEGTGTEIHDNGGCGIRAEEGKVEIHDGAMSSVNKNGQGGIWALGGLSLPPNFVVEDNGGTGIFAGGSGGIHEGYEALSLENVKVRNNQGEGISIVDLNLAIRGAGNEIINNAGHGIFSLAGDVTIEGTGTEIHDNGGCGIRAEEGKVEIHDGAMSSVNKNGQGGIWALGGLSLPPNFVVEDNGGTGILAGGSGGIHEGYEALSLENVKVRNNQGEGISIVDLNLTIRGAGNEITNNAGHGILTLAGDVTIEGACEIHNNGGWGIRANAGLVEICDGANISGNGQGDIYCPGSVK